MFQNMTIQTAEYALKQVEEKLKAGTWSRDLSTDALTWSFNLYRIMGLEMSAEAPTLEVYQSLVHPDDKQEFDSAVGLASHSRINNRRFRIIRPDGSLRWLEGHTQLHFDRAGMPIMLSGVVSDVTEEEELKRKLRAETQFSALLMQQVDGIVWRADPQGHMIDSKNWLQLTGETPEEWAKLSSMHPEDRKTYGKAWDAAIASHGRFSCTVRIRMRDGKYTSARSSAFPYYDAHGKIEYWVGYTVLGVDKSVPVELSGVTSSLIRAARALLDWSAMELAKKADVSFSTVRRIEKSTSSVRPEMIRSVLRTFEKHGIVFGGDGPISLSLAGDMLSLAAGGQVGRSDPD